MKTFVLMNKKTGDLFIGYPMMFLHQSWLADLQPPNSGAFEIAAVQQDGWVMEADHFQFKWFMNMGADKFFENLGEL